MDNWNESDLEKAQRCCNIQTSAELDELIVNEVFIKIAEPGDYEEAYRDYLAANPTELDWVSFKDFMEEIQEGYGGCDTLEIARLLVLSQGIYYDRDYCQ